MTLNEIKKKYNSKITIKEVHPYEILITGYDENNSFDRKVVAKTCKLSNKGFHVVIA